MPEQSFRLAVSILEPLIRAHPDSTSVKRDLARCYNNLGILKKTTDHMAEAEQCYVRAIEILEPLYRGEQLEPDGRQALAQCYTNLGSVKGMTGNMPEAREWIQKAIPIFEALTGRSREIRGSRKTWASPMATWGCCSC